MKKKKPGIKDNKYSKKEKLRLVEKICEEECGLLYLEKDIDVAYDHYSGDVQTVFLKENPKTTNRVTHEAVKHIAERIRTEVSERWNLGLVVSRPEMFAWYTGEKEDDLT